jgi:uncharacterized protein YjbJ (UPF0337 family)
MNTRQSTSDRVKGAARTVKGKAKQVAGILTNNRKLESEGKGDELAGRVQKKVGQIERVFEP